MGRQNLSAFVGVDLGRLNKTQASINFLVVQECLVGNSPSKFVSSPHLTDFKI